MTQLYQSIKDCVSDRGVPNPGVPVLDQQHVGPSQFDQPFVETPIAVAAALVLFEPRHALVADEGTASARILRQRGCRPRAAAFFSRGIRML